METLDQIFDNLKLTENGDIAFKSTLNKYADILFMSAYFEKHLSEVSIGTSETDKLFSMFMRDPRHGIGRRDLGRVLMEQSECSIEQIMKAGRADDLLYSRNFHAVADYLRKEIEKGNELVKKWMPRYSSKNLVMARAFAKYWGMNKQQYGHFIKANTVERSLTEKRTDDINFEHVPSLAMIKYAKRFAKSPDTKDRYMEYLEAVKRGEKKLNVSTTNVYDIYRNRNEIDADLFFDKLEKIEISCLPIIDSSGSMYDKNDSIGKALSVGHYLAKCSTYCPNMAISFSARPRLLNLAPGERKLPYIEEIKRMITGECSNTDLERVMNLLSTFGKFPEYLIILSDMEFDCGSAYSKDRLMRIWKAKGYKTKIVWWNFNTRAKTCPETDEYGNIFMSGYNPWLLKFMSCEFDSARFIEKLLEEYSKVIEK